MDQPCRDSRACFVWLRLVSFASFGVVWEAGGMAVGNANPTSCLRSPKGHLSLIWSSVAAVVRGMERNRFGSEPTKMLPTHLFKPWLLYRILDVLAGKFGNKIFDVCILQSNAEIRVRTNTIVLRSVSFGEASMKAGGGSELRACCDSAERNVRLTLQGTSGARWSWPRTCGNTAPHGRDVRSMAA